MELTDRETVSHFMYLMALTNRNTLCLPYGINIIKEVTEFTYLGAKLTINGTCDTEISARISKARQAFGMLKSTWKAKISVPKQSSVSSKAIS